jgi:hypothetical protein
MVRIERPTILTNVANVAAAIDALLAIVVAINAKALKLAGNESVPIAVMRRDVVRNGGCRHDAPVEAGFARRLGG